MDIYCRTTDGLQDQKIIITKKSRPGKCSDGFPFGRFYGRKHAWKPERDFPVCEIIIARHNCAVNRLRVRHGAPLHYNFLDYKIMAEN